MLIKCQEAGKALTRSRSPKRRAGADRGNAALTLRQTVKQEQLHLLRHAARIEAKTRGKTMSKSDSDYESKAKSQFATHIHTQILWPTLVPTAAAMESSCVCEYV